ncbi:Hsp70 family protein [Catenuloplanes indicus]|uniref:Uncharacterized protein n=1 Tax=Catenuloplanes indicus TaxID=137267 RepID=A0AAE3W2C7_9ACTN|nr:Hsp70 family protein [Catenuloplanes indicus]MDQ0368096.1 hypothetical protein [Catenuloplanes indicus]
MSDGTYGLGVDLGTSNTVAVLRTPDGRTRPLLFDGQPIMPSGVYLDPEGRLHVGRDAQRLAQADPARYEPNPKRRIDETSVLLGDREIPVVDLLAAVLGAVARAAVEAVGFLPPAMLTHPAAWGPVRRATLAEAVARAGWPPVAAAPGQPGTRFTPEPVAAARYFAEVLHRPVPAGSALAVFDFGGGTLDVAVVRNDGLGPSGRPVFSVVSSGGVADLGGLDLDAALVDHVGRTLTGPAPQPGPHATRGGSATPGAAVTTGGPQAASTGPEISPDGPTQRLDLAAAQAWQALTQPATVTQWRNRRQLWDDVRGAKEMLSRATVAPIAVPGVERAVHLTREELEHVVTPLLRRGVHETAGVIRAAGVTPDRLAGLFLVGGSSRVPMVGRLLHSDLHIPPTVLEQPELPVAEGALAELLATIPAQSPAPPVTSAPPVSSAPVSPTAMIPGAVPGGPPPVKRPRRSLVPVAVAAAVALVVLVTAGTLIYLSPWSRVAPVAFADLTEGTLIPAVPDEPDSTVFEVFTDVVGDRAYVAAQRDDKTLEIAGVGLDGTEVWRRTTDRATAFTWQSIHATDRYVIANGDGSSEQPRPLVAWDRDGEPLWQEQIASQDLIWLFNDVLVVARDEERQLIGYRLADGEVAWDMPIPRGEFSDYYRVVLIASPGDRTGPAAAGGTPFGWNADADQRLVLITADQRAQVINVDDGSVAASGTVDVEPSSLSPSLGVQMVADSRQLYIGTTGDRYRIEAYDLTTFGTAQVVYNDTAGRTLKTLTLCGDGRLCLADLADEGTDQVAVYDVADGGKQVMRVDAPGLTGLTDTGAIVPSGTGLLLWHRPKDGAYRTALYDDAGDRIFEWNGVAARVNARSFLIFDREPAGDAPSTEGVPLSATVDNGDAPQQIGTLPAVRLGTCSWNETTIICGSGPNGFRIQRFAED